MTVKKFNELYGKRGGIKQLTEFRNECSTLLFMSKHFGVSKERVRQWMGELFEDGYDPRKRRRDLRTATIEDLIKTAGIDEVRKLHFNRKCLKQAIKNLKKHDTKRSGN